MPRRMSTCQCRTSWMKFTRSAVLSASWSRELTCPCRNSWVSTTSSRCWCGTRSTWSRQQQVQVAIILDRHVDCRSAGLSARLFSVWSAPLFPWTHQWDTSYPSHQRERRTMHGRLAQYAPVQFTFITHLDTADRKYFSSVTRSEQVSLDNQLLHDANFSPNREGAKAHALRSSGQVSALCSES